MSRLAVFFCVLLAFGLTLPASASSKPDETEMKVKIYATPGQVETFARDVLEFYDAGPGWYVCAVNKPVYDELAGLGYRIDVIVPDVHARASMYDAFFHTYQQLRDTWAIIAQNHPDICVLDTIGNSANGNLMLAMKVSDNPRQMEGEPRICFDCSIHGNENNGCEIAHYVLLQLVNGYGVDPQITYFVNNREIWLVPMDNPDGLISRSRYNGHGVDCNRNYGYAWDTGAGGGTGAFSEPEVQSFYHLAEDNPMSAWSQYHSGATTAMQPWGYTTKATPDSVIQAYEMQRYGQICGYEYGQISRILYSVSGGSTDWYYGARGALGYAVEVCGGQPSPPSEIDTICHANWTAMKEQIARVSRGIMGYVSDSSSGRPLLARIMVSPPDWLTYTDSTGYYHKNVWAGTYAVTAIANGYRPKTVSNVVVPADTFVNVNIVLAADTIEPTCAFRVTTCRIAESPANTNPTNAIWALGRHDDRRFSLGNGGYASFDMGGRTSIINGPGSDFNVIEGDADPEACSVYVSNDWNGPWHYVGFGTGTQGYDLTAAGMSTARYVRVADDNAGPGGPYAGFDLDAIEAVTINAPAVVYQSQTVLDSPPGGNNDGKLDAGEDAALTVTLKNAGRMGVSNVTAVLRTQDQFLSVQDSTGSYGDIMPDSVRTNNGDKFRVAADAATPREHAAQMTMYLSGTDYADSVRFTITVGELRTVDPIPDGPRTPALYWAYDDVDSGYAPHPTYGWVEIRSQGTRIPYPNNDDVVAVNLPTGFGPFKFYGQRSTQVSVSADGWVAAGNYTQSNYSNTSLPGTQAPPAVIAANWDDLYPDYNSTGYVYYYHDAAGHRFIIEYDSVAYYNPRATRDKFEVVIYDTTLAAPDGNSVIVAQYMTANGFGSSTVGMQDPTRAIGIQDFYNGALTRGAAPIAPGRAIKYTTDDPTGIAEPSTGVSLAGRLAVALMTSPVRGRALVRYSVPASGNVALGVYDMSGRLVRQLAAGLHRPGNYHVAWDGTDAHGRKVAAGVYWLRLADDAGSTAAKAVLLR